MANMYTLEQWYHDKEAKFDISECGMINTLHDSMIYDILKSKMCRVNCYDYGNVEGNLQLISLLSEIYHCDKTNILITNGATEALYLILCCLSKGNTVAYQIPYYHDIDHIILGFGGTPKHIHLKNGIESVVQANNESQKDMDLLILNYPNNPTGTIIADSEYNQILKLSKRTDMITVFDEVCSDIILNGQQSYMEHNIGKNLDNAIVINSLSKSYGIPGVRIGWIVANEKVINKCRTMKENVSNSTSMFSQMLALGILEKRDVIIQNNIEILRSNLMLLVNFMEQNKDIFEFTKPQGGACCFVKLKVQISVHQFCLDLYNKASVLLVPGEYFGYENYFRLGFGIPTNQFEQAIQLLNEFIDSYFHK